MWKEIFHFRFYKCSTPLRNIATSIENWTMYSKWGSNEIGQKCIHQNINLNLHIRPWNALLGHWPYNTIFLGQKCTLLVLRFLFIKFSLYYQTFLIYSKKYIYFFLNKKTPRKLKKNLKIKTWQMYISWYIYFFYQASFSLHT